MEFHGLDFFFALSLENYSNYFMTLLAGSQVSDRCSLGGYLFFVAIYLMLFTLASYKDMHKNLDKFEFWLQWN